MKLKKELETGMRIHCKNETEAMQLQEITESQGLGKLPFTEDICDIVYVIHKNDPDIPDCVRWSDKFNNNVCEFSDLILPETTMTAAEVLNWLKKCTSEYSNERKEYEDLFGDLTVDELLTLHPIHEIISTIENYKNQRDILNKRTELKRQLGESINQKMEELLSDYYNDLKKEDGCKYSGDITPDQTVRWDNIVDDIVDLFEELAEQNRTGNRKEN